MAIAVKEEQSMVSVVMPNRNLEAKPQSESLKADSSFFD